MPNPGALASLQAFEKDNVNTVVQIPDYWLRQRLASQQREAVVVEAFVAFDEMFYLHLRWKDGDDRHHPEMSLSSVGAQHHKLMLDVSVQSPQFTFASGDLRDAGGNAQWSPCTWSTLTRPAEVQRPISLLPLRIDVQPTLHNDLSISLDQTVVFTLTGTIWELDDAPTASLHCKTFRSRMQDPNESGALPDITTRMIANISLAQSASGLEPDLLLVPDAEVEEKEEDDEQSSCSAGRGEAAAFGSTDGLASSSKFGLVKRGDDRGQARPAHSFLLKAQSPVFRRMLAAPMTEAAEGVVRMTGVAPRQLDDLLGTIYSFALPEEVREDDERLMALLSAADRYELLALRDECAALLEPRVCEENMAALLKVADLHQAQSLRTAVLGFIAGRLERVAAVMDVDDRAMRKSIRDYLAAAESRTKKHAAAIDMKPAEVTLTV